MQITVAAAIMVLYIGSYTTIGVQKNVSITLTTHVRGTLWSWKAKQKLFICICENSVQIQQIPHNEKISNISCWTYWWIWEHENHLFNIYNHKSERITNKPPSFQFTKKKTQQKRTRGRQMSAMEHSSSSFITSFQT